jgi:predicted nucleic acid-binding protein
MTVVSDSTPLIALAKINRLDLLKDFFGEIYIPEEVYDEVVRRGGNLAGSSEVASCSWIKVESVKNRMAVETLSLTLDKGEAEAIVLSREKESLLIIDDGAGRKTAELLGVKITGTVGILLLASKDGRLSLRKTMDELKSVGFRLSETQYQRILSVD